MKTIKTKLKEFDKEYDTAGQPIYEPIQNCDCGIIGGCKKCNSWGLKISKLEKERQKLDDWKRRFDEDVERRSKIFFNPLKK